MGQKFRRGFTATEKTELWDRWQKGESLKAIGRAHTSTATNGEQARTRRTFGVITRCFIATVWATGAAGLFGSGSMTRWWARVSAQSQIQPDEIDAAVAQPTQSAEMMTASANVSEQSDRGHIASALTPISVGLYHCPTMPRLLTQAVLIGRNEVSGYARLLESQSLSLAQAPGPQNPTP